jgi:broad specificity phosphatase PhoE
MSDFNMDTENDDAVDGPQTIFVMRHGDRYDFDVGMPVWEQTALRSHDPPLSLDVGQAQVLDMLTHFRSLRESEPDLQVTKVLTSPFLRCITTSHPIAAAWDTPLLIENSLWEVSAQGETMASARERACYFPRVDVTYESLFRPALDETFPRGCLERYSNAAYAIEEKFLSRGPGRQPGIAVCTHAAGVITIVSALLRVSMDDINPATPCALYRLDRVNTAAPWTLHAESGLATTDGAACDKKGAQVSHLQLSQSLLKQSKTGAWPVRTKNMGKAELAQSSYGGSYPTWADLWLEEAESNKTWMKK